MQTMVSLTCKIFQRVMNLLGHGRKLCGCALCQTQLREAGSEWTQSTNSSCPSSPVPHLTSLHLLVKSRFRIEAAGVGWCCLLRECLQTVIFFFRRIGISCFCNTPNMLSKFQMLQPLTPRLLGTRYVMLSLLSFLQTPTTVHQRGPDLYHDGTKKWRLGGGERGMVSSNTYLPHRWVRSQQKTNGTPGTGHEMGYFVEGL